MTVGQRIPRIEDPRLLTAGGTYVADVRDRDLDGAVHAHFIRSTLAHGRILDVDCTEALSRP